MFHSDCKRTMKNLLMTAAFLLAFTAQARKPLTPHWYTGEITLRNNQVLLCEYNYDPFTDLLQVKEDNRVKILNARQIQSFAYFDDSNNTQRYFVSMFFGNRFRSNRVFFEKVLDGELTLLRRYKSATIARRARNEAEEIWYDSRNYYNYYIYNEEKLTSFHDFKKKGFGQIIAEYKQALESFIHRRKLNLNTQRGAFLVINQYNVLKGFPGLSVF